MHDADLEDTVMKKKRKIDVHMFFFPFLCFGIPDLALGILKLLIRVCFRDVLQPAKGLLICSWHDITIIQFVRQMYSIYSKSLLFKVLAMYIIA